MHQCSGSDLYYWQNRCGNRIPDCPNREDESRNNPNCTRGAPNPGPNPVPTKGPTVVENGDCPVLRRGGCNGGTQRAIDRLTDRVYSVNECRAKCAGNSQCVTFSVGVRNGMKRCVTYKAGCEDPRRAVVQVIFR